MAVVGASADWSGMLGTPVRAHERRNPGLDAPPVRMLAEGSAVIRLGHDQIPRSCARAISLLWHLQRRLYRLGQHSFMRLCAIRMQPDGQVIAVGNLYNLPAFADFGFANAKASFFAGTKCPSTDGCGHSILPWASNRLNNARQIHFHVPPLERTQKRRQQVADEPSTRGRFSRAHPVLKAQRMALSVVRSSFGLRPGPGSCFEIKGRIAAHGSAVASCRLISTD
jgi:hypothetical protein